MYACFNIRAGAIGALPLSLGLRLKVKRMGCIPLHLTMARLPKQDTSIASQWVEQCISEFVCAASFANTYRRAAPSYTPQEPDLKVQK